MAVILIFQINLEKPLAQTIYLVRDNIQILISGTSSVHDWQMQSSRESGSATITFNNDGSIKNISNINFSTTVSALKSTHSSMDNNAWKALKKDAFPNISFSSVNCSVTNLGNAGYLVTCNGKLEIAGIFKEISIPVKLTLNRDKSISIYGTQNINMLDFGVTPPSAIFGTIKCDKNVVVNLSGTLKQ